MNLTVTIMDSPTASGAGWCALAFCRAALAQSHQVEVLFHAEASYTVLGPATLDDGQPGLRQQWLDLAAAGGLSLYVCPAASDRRFANAVQAPFERLGLTTWLDRVAHSERCVQFGGGQ